MRCVLDTNVLVSGMISTTGCVARVVDFLRVDRLVLVVDDRILAEYADVLTREYLRRYFTLAEAENTVEFLRHASDHVVSSAVVSSLPDPGDIPFLEAALTRAVPLVTGNAKHFPRNLRRGCEILSPRAFLLKYFPE